MSNARSRALEEFSRHGAERFFEEDREVSRYFGQNVFDLKKMQRYLPQEVYREVCASVREGARIDRATAEYVAAGMKAWAMEMGATHYTHWFHPLTDSTAEKHEAFIEADGGGEVFENFRGSALVQQEPDASSFPNGGLRNTFEARGYTAWDPTSPAFIMDRTLCIPTVFVSYTGEALDLKIPHLKSLQCLDHAASDVARLFDPSVRRVNAMLGIEQEYFVVDEALFRARPDLQLCSRTLLGHTSAKDQQLEDHYFGAIPARVMAFMKDFETEAYKLGILLKTRHNEVAPNQFECAPVYGEANLASDHNLILMILMRKVAKRHRLKVLFHEKPFAGVNGSGKHCNWSIVTDAGVNLLSPGRSPETNLQFLSFFVSVIRAVYEHHHLLMATTASLANSYRLGGNEAPPAVMSVFIGSTLDRVLDAIENGNAETLSDIERKLDIVHKIPEIRPDNTDRNRTSPFAFTGNRFEFRAVGSSVNVCSSMFVLNTVVAQQLRRFRELADRHLAGGDALNEAVIKVIRQFISESRDIRFEGNGYSREWQEEAGRRGLRGIRSVPEAYRAWIAPETVSLFVSQGVLSERELEARYEVLNEIFVKKLQIEARVQGDLVINHIIPTAIKFQNVLLENYRGLLAVFGDVKARELAGRELEQIEKISRYINDLRSMVHDMIEARKTANALDSIPERARSYDRDVLPFMAEIRQRADKLEMLVDDELWPLPKYRELLFCR